MPEAVILLQLWVLAYGKSIVASSNRLAGKVPKLAHQCLRSHDILAGVSSIWIPDITGHSATINACRNIYKYGYHINRSGLAFQGFPRNRGGLADCGANRVRGIRVACR